MFSQLAKQFQTWPYRVEILELQDLAATDYM